MSQEIAVTEKTVRNDLERLNSILDGAIKCGEALVGSSPGKEPGERPEARGIVDVIEHSLIVAIDKASAVADLLRRIESSL